MDLSVSLWGFLTFVCYLVIAEFFLRFLTMQFADTTVGKALAYING